MKERIELVGLPEVTQEPIKFVDMTPDANLPLRILQAYRQNCDFRWVSEPPGNLVVDTMNEAAAKRAIILDRAIAKLELEMP